MISFETVNEVNIEFTNAITWGVCVNEQSGYTVPISINRGESFEISNLTRKHKTKSSLYGKYNTVYLRTGNLTPKQKKELLDMGRCCVDISIRLVGVNTSRNGERYLKFKIIKLRRTEKKEKTEEIE